MVYAEISSEKRAGYFDLPLVDESDAAAAPRHCRRRRRGNARARGGDSSDA